MLPGDLSALCLYVCVLFCVFVCCVVYILYCHAFVCPFSVISMSMYLHVCLPACLCSIYPMYTVFVCVCVSVCWCFMQNSNRFQSLFLPQLLSSLHCSSLCFPLSFLWVSQFLPHFPSQWSLHCVSMSAHLSLSFSLLLFLPKIPPPHLFRIVFLFLLLLTHAHTRTLYAFFLFHLFVLQQLHLSFSSALLMKKRQ